MLITTDLATQLSDVPTEWVFENYLGLDTLAGQELWMKSIFNPADTNPSMHVYMTPSKVYRYKDFSTGKGGDGVDLVRELIRSDRQMENLPSVGEAILVIVTDYNDFVASGGSRESRELKVHAKYRVSGTQLRTWNTLDKKYWTQYGIGSQLLAKYNVQPLELYTMVKDQDGQKTEIVIRGDYLYGYFRKDGTLYKIYQPKIRKKKFIKVKDYIQGTDQLQMKKPYLLICSSLKDLMAIDAMEFKSFEMVAPDSENTPIPKHVIQSYLHKYKKVATLFDNDTAGIASMQNYHDKYGLPFVKFLEAKDVAEAVKLFKMPKAKLDLYNTLLLTFKKQS